MTAKTLGVCALVAVALFGAGWIIGASGRSTAVEQQARVELQALLAQARGHVLEGRVSLFQINFGAASQQFDCARAAIESAQTHLRQRGDAERAGQLEIAVAVVATRNGSRSRWTRARRTPPKRRSARWKRRSRGEACLASAEGGGQARPLQTRPD